MSQFERHLKLEQLFFTYKKLTPAFIRERLDEISPSTLKRDVAYLRDRMRHDISWHAPSGQYHYQPPEDGVAVTSTIKYTFDEMISLFTLVQILDDLSHGLLARHVKPIRDRVLALVDGGSRKIIPISRFVRVLSMRHRPTSPDTLSFLLQKLEEGEKVKLAYHSRHENKLTERLVSPQRLVNYRFNWYLDAYCHLKKSLRTFSVDRIRKATPVREKAKVVPAAILDRYFATGYGIFSGRRVKKARLVFSESHSPWIAQTVWHPRQKGTFKDNRYFLEIPYADDRELLLDILRYSPEVEVLSPPALRAKVAESLKKAVSVYE